MKQIFFALFLSSIAHAQDFSYLVQGDQHFNGSNQPGACQTFPTWVTAHKVSNNIKAILSTGDWPDVQGAQFANCWAAIDATIPILSAPGNHDYQGASYGAEAISTRGSVNETSTFDPDIGYGRISGASWFNGDYYHDSTGSQANEWFTVTVGSRKLLFMSLEFFPRLAVLTWAGTVLDAHRSYETVIITHGYLNNNGTLTAWNDSFGPNAYGLAASGNTNSTGYSGIGIQGWAAAYPQIRAIHCGHQISGAHQAHRLDGAINGLFINYQDLTTNVATFNIITIHSNGTATVTSYDPFTAAGQSVAYDIPWVALGGMNSLPTSIGLQ